MECTRTHQVGALKGLVGQKTISEGNIEDALK
jgi:hypothetical protein